MYQLPKLKSEKGLAHGFSSVSEENLSFLWGEEKEVLNNRKKFLGELGVNPEKCAVMSILDSDNIVSVDINSNLGVGKNIVIRADALATSDKNIFLFLLTADCLPVIFFDPLQNILVLAHCSRKSTGVKLSEKVINFMKDKYKTNPADLIIGIGPGIHKESYIKETDSISEERSREWKNFLHKSPDNQIAIDIVGYNRYQLVSAGVKEENIEVSDIDTAADSNFFSHYRSKKNGEIEGRFAAVVGMV